MMKMNLSRTLENEILVPWEVFFFEISVPGVPPWFL